VSEERKRQQRHAPSDLANLPVEAECLVVARRRANVAESQAVFDKSGSTAALATVQCDYVLAN
jgi:hypothetical protein